MRDHETGLADGRACLEAALMYLAHGWSVIPLCPPDHVGVGKEHGRSCKSRGKAPLMAWAEFQTRIADEAEIREWWRHWPNANVGVVLGTISGMIGLDIDGPAGEAALASLSGNNLPETLEFVTPGGGRRLLYLCSDETKIRPFQLSGGDKQEVRLLGDGSQTVAPPSRHNTGGYYQWIKGP